MNSTCTAATTQRAQLIDLKAAFPDQDAQFRETCILEGFTPAEACAYAAGEIQARPEIIAAAVDRYTKQREAGTATAGGPISAVNAALKQQGRAELTEAEARQLSVSDLDDPEAREWLQAWDHDAELREEYDGNQGAYLAYCRANAAGRVRVLGEREE